MLQDTLRILALLFTALALAPAAAHVLELPNKLKLARDEYLIVQKIYRDWHFLGIVVLAALLTTFALAVAMRTRPEAFYAAIAAAVCIFAAQFVFWIATLPVNRRTRIGLSSRMTGNTSATDGSIRTPRVQY
jgi:hypothetical protein